VIGAAAVVGMSGSTTSEFPILRRFDEVLDLVSFSNPSVLWGVPSYVLKILLALQHNQSKIENLRLINVSGEPCGPKLRAHLREAAQSLTANQVVISDSLGATEMQFSLVECDGGNGFHNPVPEIARLSVIDHAGKELLDGEAGRLQVTHLNRRGTVLIKYLLGDLAIMDQKACQNCGWTGGRIIKHLGREGKFVKVRGQMVNAQSLQDYLESIDYITDYKVSISQDGQSGLDELSVDLATKTGSLSDDDRMTLQAQLNDLAGLRLQIRLVEQNQIWEPEAGMKPKRFVDLRVSN
jgi:phenylacetate-coenzyme A ligase PaaK-like adenylate-forming protein